MGNLDDLTTVEHACEVFSRQYGIDPPITVADVVSYHTVDGDTLVVKINVSIPTTHRTFTNPGDRWSEFRYHRGSKNREEMIEGMERDRSIA